MQLLQNLLGMRHVLLPGPHDPVTADAFSGAVNQIFVVFHDSNEVLVALKAFHETVLEPSTGAELRSQRLLDLFVGMSRHLNVDTKVVGEGFFMKAFSVDAQVQQQLVGIQVLGFRVSEGQPSIAAALDFGPTGRRCPITLGSDLAETLGCLLVELASVVRTQVAATRQVPGALQPIEMGPEFMQAVNRRLARSR
jgi:hypothetical protein